MTIILIIVYMILFTISYLICKQERNESGNANNWSDILLTIIFCIGNVLFLTYMLTLYIKDIKLSTKPPKWL